MAKANSNISLVEFEFTADGLANFRKKMADLFKIAPVARIKITEKQILVYSANKFFHTFKSALLDTKETFTLTSGEIPDTGIDFVVLNTRNLVQTVNFFAGTNPVKIAFKQLRGAPTASEMRISDGDLNLAFVGGDSSELRSITAAQIEQKLDPADSLFSFTITGDELTKIKRLATLRDKDAINIWIRNGDIRIGQSSWDVRVGHSDEKETYIFDKKYLSCIDLADVITIYAFDSFISVRGTETNLMIGRELDEL